MKSYKITGLHPSHLASRDDLFNLDSEWRDLTFPTDGDTWEADDSNESELRLTCAQCGCCLEEAPEDGVVYCPDCGGEFFYVSRLITRQIVEVSGVSAYLSPNRFLHFKLPPSLPEGYQLYYTWGEEKPSFQSARYTTPRSCPDGVTKIQYLLLFPDDTCTRVMQDVLTSPAEPLPPCPICGQALTRTNDCQFCPVCQYREHHDSEGKLVSSGSHILCPVCNNEFDAGQADTHCPSCGVHIYFQANDAGWIYDPPAKTVAERRGSILKGATADHCEKESESKSVEISDRSRLACALLCLMPCTLLCFCGLHRFYAGRNITGFLELVTFGFFGIGQLIDLILILLGCFRDNQGRPIRRWL